jgi:hypothetical protein
MSGQSWAKKLFPEPERSLQRRTKWQVQLPHAGFVMGKAATGATSGDSTESTTMVLPQMYALIVVGKALHQGLSA